MEVSAYVCVRGGRVGGEGGGNIAEVVRMMGTAW